MKKVININFQGRVVPIEENAYDELQSYIDSLRNYFAAEEGKEEIINDIESRISELFQQKLKNGATCITDEDVNHIIDNMGRPADFEEAAGDTQTNKTKEETFTSHKSQSWNWNNKRLYRDDQNKILGGVCSGIAAYLNIDPWIVRIVFILSGIGFLAYIILWIFVPGSSTLDNGARKKLYRNPDGKILGGVCNGIGSYFDINPWLPRVIFLLPFISFIFRWHTFGPFSFPNFIKLSFSPGTLIIYIILWLVIPEATTTSEKLEMKGEKVDLNSIKKSVLDEMKSVGERVGKMGMKAGEFAKEKGGEMGKDIYQATHRTGRGIGHIITTLVKIFLYIILGCIAFSIIVAVFSVAIVAIGLFPLKDFIVTDGLQNFLAWGTLIFFIGVPVVGIITYIIRKLARIKSKNNFIRYSFIGLWIVGWICFFALISYVGRDFKYVSSVNEQQVELSQPTVGYLEVRPYQNKDFRRRGWLRFEPFSDMGLGDDTALIGNVNIRISKSPTDSFQVTFIKMSNGPTRRNADRIASQINFTALQTDSILWLDKAISINKFDKFRNQYVEVTIAVPVGHKIKIDKYMGYRNRVKFGIFANDRDNYYDRDNYDYDYSYGVTYVMREDGLYNMEGHKSGDDWNSDDNGNIDEENYRYHSPVSLDSIQQKQKMEILEMEKSIDSAKEIHQKQLERLKDSLQKQKKEIDSKLQKIESANAISVTLPTLMAERKSYPFVNFI